MLHILTICLDAAPFILRHLSILDALDLPWRWYCVEGRAAAVKDTAWCRSMPPRLSNDGTHEMLREISSRHPRVVHLHKPLWNGKVEMCNAALERAKEAGVLLQMDADEFYTTDQFLMIHDMMLIGKESHAKFRCKYRVGVNIQTIGVGYGNYANEWQRAWKYHGTERWTSHEPPVLAGNKGLCVPIEITAACGLVFDHFSYCFDKQVKEKCDYYGYGQAGLDGWRRLQLNTKWPTRLADFFPWVKDETQCDLIWKPHSTSFLDDTGTSAGRSLLSNTRLPKAIAPA